MQRELDELDKYLETGVMGYGLQEDTVKKSKLQTEVQRLQAELQKRDKADAKLERELEKLGIHLHRG